MIKKLTIIFALAVAALNCHAERTNLYDKLPGEGYVGYAGVETVSPGFFGDGGFAAGVTTEHGWMVTPKVFFGGGVGYIRDFEQSEGVVPIFASGRFFFPSEYMRKIYPHVSARLGGEIATHGGSGTFMQLSVGFRVPFSDSFAINVEVGPQYATKFRREHRVGEESYGKGFKAEGMRFAFFGRVMFEF